MDPGSAAYVVGFGLRVQGQVDQQRIRDACRALTARYDILRASYPADDLGEPTVVLHEDTGAEVPVMDLRGVDDPLASAEEELSRILATPFDVAAGPLARFHSLTLADDDHVVLFTAHHIIVDGNSLDIILEDLAEYLTDGRVTRPVSDDYSSFVAMQANLFRTPGYEADSRWWLDQFQDVPADLPLPTDSPVPAVNDFSGHHYYFRLDQDLYEAADRFARANRITPFVLHLTVWAALLGRTAATDDVCVGVPLDQRILGRFERTVGMFAQSLPLRIRPSEDKSLLDLAA